MNANSIGIQTIMPKTATSPQTTPQQQANDRDADRKPVEAKQPLTPPPRGMGQFVDKTA
jgi:hypothetical protein